MAVVTISPKGQVVIPAKIRKKLGLKPGTKVYVTADGPNVLVSQIQKDPITAACGFLKGGPSLAEELVQSRKEEVAREKNVRYR